MKTKITVTNTSKYKISERQLQALSDITSRTPHLAFRPVPSLKRTIHTGRLFLAMEHGVIIGWIEAYHLWKNWYGLSSLFVLPQYRDQGVGRGMLLPAAIEYLQGKQIYAATSNTLVPAELLKHGFKQVSFFSYPWQLILALIKERYTTPASWIKLFKITRQPMRYFARHLQT